MKIRGVHIDLKTQRLRFPVLLDILTDIASRGFNTVLLEYQDNFPYQGDLARFSGPDALSLDEVFALKAHCKKLGLEIIPMVQSIGHMYWVTRHADCAPFGEAYHEMGPGSHSLCPSQPESFAIFRKLARQVMEQHPESTYFHIGGDEVHFSDTCPACAGKDRGQLLGSYYRQVLDYTKEQGFTPAMWGDMVLKYESVRSFISRDTLIFDWDYMNGLSQAHARQVYGSIPSFVPCSDNSFARTRLLIGEGFPVVTAPAVRSMGDTSFLGRNVHPDNCMQALLEAMDSGGEGIVITSWAVRLVPWPLTQLSFTAVSELLKDPGCGIAHIRSAFCREAFGTDSASLLQSLLELTEQATVARLNADFLSSGEDYMDAETGLFRSAPLLTRPGTRDFRGNERIIRDYAQMAAAAEDFLRQLDTHCGETETASLWRWAGRCAYVYGRFVAALCRRWNDVSWLRAQLEVFGQFRTDCETVLSPYLTEHAMESELYARVTVYTDLIEQLLDE